MDFHGEDDGSVLWMQERLNFLERQHRIWRIQYEERERRMKQEYEEKLAEIDEATARAAKKLELEYEAKKKAIMNQFKPAIAHQYATDPPMMFSQSKPSLVADTAMQDVELPSKQSSVPTPCTEPKKSPIVKVAPVVVVEQPVVFPKELRRCEVENGNQTNTRKLTSNDTSDESRNDGINNRPSYSLSRVLYEEIHDWFKEVHLLAQIRRVHALRDEILPPSNSTCGTGDAQSVEQVAITNPSALFDEGFVDTHESGEGVLLTTILTVFDPGGTV